jgi:hypothetical protein
LVHFIFFQIVEKSPPLTDHFEKTPSGVMVPLVDFKMFCEISNPLAEQSDLNLWGTRVLLMVFKLLDDLFLLLLNECHEIPPFNET